ncbi:MAG: HD domain-containing phosphohydrolase [Pseudomonadota bacterium]
MTINTLTIFMILIGAIFLFMSFPPAINIWRNTSGRLRQKWLIILYLMGLFIAGYIFFDIILISNLPFPVELLTGGVFLGGAFFVYVIIHISQNTIAARQKAEEAIALAKEDWESTFDAVADMITVHDMDFNIIRANPAAESILGLQLRQGMPSVKCFGSYHGTEKPPSDCASCQSLQTGKPSTVEIFEPYLNRHLEIRAMPRFGRDRELVGLIHVVRDITERKRTEEELRRSEKKYRGILEDMDDAYYELDLSGNLVFFNEALVEKTGYSRGELMGMNYRQYISPEKYKSVSRVFSEIYRTGQPERLFDYEVIMKDGQTRNYESWANLIFDNHKQPIGFRGMARDITARKQAEQKLKHTLESLRKAISTTVQVMVSAVETRDPYTSGHQLRSADLARAIGSEMGLPPDKIEGIRMAGSIHDIGKLSIPAEILSKPTKLSEIEFSLIKEHARTGDEILKAVVSPWPLAEIVPQHHERMDGSGYPQKLKGEEILMEARILSVADVVEAMASHRPYRPGLGIDAALAEIEKNRGTIYDKTVADACLRLFREKGFILEGA